MKYYSKNSYQPFILVALILIASSIQAAGAIKCPNKETVGCNATKRPQCSASGNKSTGHFNVRQGQCTDNFFSPNSGPTVEGKQCVYPGSNGQGTCSGFIYMTPLKMGTVAKI